HERHGRLAHTSEPGDVALRDPPGGGRHPEFLTNTYWRLVVGKSDHAAAGLSRGCAQVSGPLRWLTNTHNHRDRPCGRGRSDRRRGARTPHAYDCRTAAIHPARGTAPPRPT